MARIDQKTVATTIATGDQIPFVDISESNQSEKLKLIAYENFVTNVGTVVEPITPAACTISLGGTSTTYYWKQWVRQGQKIRYSRVYSVSHTSDQTVAASLYVSGTRERTGTVNVDAANEWFTVDMSTDYTTSTAMEVVLAITLQSTNSITLLGYNSRSITDLCSSEGSTATPPATIGTESTTASMPYSIWY